VPTTDHEEIRRTLTLQAHLRDDGGVDDWPDNFVADAVFISPAGRFEGRSAIAEHLNAIYESGGKIGKHFLGPSVIDVHDDTATSKTDFTFIAPTGDGTFRLLASGRYHDHLARSDDGRWRFTERDVHLVGATPPEVIDGTRAWHRPLGHTHGDSLDPDTAQTPGMTRYEAISGRLSGSKNIWMGRNHVAPGMRSADHHHGKAETGIYVVSGNPVFVFLDEGVERHIQTKPGDYIYVPPFVPHREENPSPDVEAVVVLARSTQQGIVVNLPSLWAEVDDSE
jgi:uncharacterized RmlC-like cupin family protein